MMLKHGNYTFLLAFILILADISPAISEVTSAVSDSNTLKTSREAEAIFNDPLDLVRRAETIYMGKTSRTVMKMSVVTESFSREMEIESWAEGRDSFIAQIRKPQKEKGVSTLQHQGNLWNYIPKIDRVMKIPSSLMGDAWMGSHLTNDDIVKASHVDELYELSVLQQDSNTAVIKAIPRENAPVVWGAIVYYFDTVKIIPVRVEYIDETGRLSRTIEFSAPRFVKDRWIPMVMTIKPLEKPKESTVVEYLDIEIDLNLPGDIFSLSGLRKARK